jgi:hypothetical protein
MFCLSCGYSCGCDIDVDKENAEKKRGQSCGGGLLRDGNSSYYVGAVVQDPTSRSLGWNG